MANKNAVRFWLGGRQVNGLQVGVNSAGVKLAKYRERFYTVQGDTPGAKHFTNSTLPAAWRKLMEGEAPPPPTPPSPPARGSKRKAEPPPPPLGGAGAAPGGVPVEGKPRSGGKGDRGAGAGADRPGQDHIKYPCPYCQAENVASLADAEIGKSRFETCKGCRREFGARIVFAVETAAFK